jgi:hypothetical protein
MAHRLHILSFLSQQFDTQTSKLHPLHRRRGALGVQLQDSHFSFVFRAGHLPPWLYIVCTPNKLYPRVSI